jgi:arylformamidase
VAVTRAQGYQAETFVQAGAHWAVPDFATVMDVGLDAMVAQVRRAVAWVARTAASFGGDPARIYVGGHSSGGHLAGNVLVTDWKTEFGLPADAVKGGLCVSGMYDLKAVRLSARSSYVKFDDCIEHELSPQQHLDRLTAPVVVAYAANDSPEFQRQSREFADALRPIGKLQRLVVGDGLNHFEIPETLASADGLLSRAALELMQLT